MNKLQLITIKYNLTFFLIFDIYIELNIKLHELYAWLVKANIFIRVTINYTRTIFAILPYTTEMASAYVFVWEQSF